MRKYLIPAVLLLVFTGGHTARADVLYSQLDRSTLDSSFCNSADCSVFNGNKDHTEWATTTAQWYITASTTLYASFYAGMDGVSWGASLTNPQVVVTAGGCSFVGYLSTTTLAVSTLANPVLFSNVPLTASSGTCSIPSGTGVLYQIGAGNWNGQMASYTDGSGTHTKEYFFLASTASEFTDTSTRIISNHPNTSDAVIATSTPFNVEVYGYLNGTDAQTDTQLTVSIVNKSTAQNTACADVGCLFGSPIRQSWTFSASNLGVVTPGSSLSFYVSTTSLGFAEYGTYTMTSSLLRPSSYSWLSWLGFGIGDPTVLASKTTDFVVGTTTTIGEILAQSQELLTGANATTTAQALSSCNPLSFSLASCLSVLFYPSPSDFATLISEAKNDIFSVVPLGYITRAVVILTGDTATSTLPALAVTLPNGYPGAGATLTLTPWNDLLGSSSVLSLATSTDGKTLREIVEPGWDILIYTIFALAVFFELWGIEFKPGAVDNRTGQAPHMRK